MKTITHTKAKPTARNKSRKKSVHIRLDSDVHRKANQLAKADKRTLSQYVQFILEQHVQGQSQHVNNERQELLAHIESGETHGIWSVYDEFEAAEQLQAVLNNLPK